MTHDNHHPPNHHSCPPRTTNSLNRHTLPSTIHYHHTCPPLHMPTTATYPCTTTTAHHPPATPYLRLPMNDHYTFPRPPQLPTAIHQYQTGAALKMTKNLLDLPISITTAHHHTPQQHLCCTAKHHPTSSPFTPPPQHQGRELEKVSKWGSMCGSDFVMKWGCMCGSDLREP